MLYLHGTNWTIFIGLFAMHKCYVTDETADRLTAYRDGNYRSGICDWSWHAHKIRRLVPHTSRVCVSLMCCIKVIRASLKYRWHIVLANKPVVIHQLVSLWRTIGYVFKCSYTIEMIDAHLCVVIDTISIVLIYFWYALITQMLTKEANYYS